MPRRKRVKIEQPDDIRKGRLGNDRWWFTRGYGSFGATYGVWLTVNQVKKRLTSKLGGGNLVRQNAIWYWELK
jgi:hypothetical protein